MCTRPVDVSHLLDGLNANESALQVLNFLLWTHCATIDEPFKAMDDSKGNSYSQLVLTRKEVEAVDTEAVATILFEHQGGLFDSNLVGECLLGGLSGSERFHHHCHRSSRVHDLRSLSKKIFAVWLSKHNWCGLHLDDALFDLFCGLDFFRVSRQLLLASDYVHVMLEMFGNEYERQNRNQPTAAQNVDRLLEFHQRCCNNHSTSYPHVEHEAKRSRSPGGAYQLLPAPRLSSDGVLIIAFSIMMVITDIQQARSHPPFSQQQYEELFTNNSSSAAHSTTQLKDVSVLLPQEADDGERKEVVDSALLSRYFRTAVSWGKQTPSSSSCNFRCCGNSNAFKSRAGSVRIPSTSHCVPLLPPDASTEHVPDDWVSFTTLSF